MAISNTDQFTPSEPEVTIRAPEVDDEADDTQDAEPQFQPNAAKTPGDRAPATARTGGESRKAKREASLAAMSTKVRDEVSGSVKQQLTEMENRFNQMLMAASRGQQQTAQQQGPSPVEQRVAEVAQAMQAELSAFQNHDAKKGAYDLTRYHQLKNQHDQLNARIGAAAQLQEMGITPQMLQQMRQGQQPVNVEARVAMQTRFQQVSAQFPWIEGGADDPKFQRAAAVGRYREALIAMGRPDNVQTDMEAALHVQNTLGIRPAAGIPRGNPAPYSNPLGGDRGGGGPRQEVKLPSAALRGVSKQEMDYIQKALFSEE
jgi:hypothetical protein